VSNALARMPEHIYRRGQIACERERHAPRPLTHAEATRVEAVTIGERVNFPLIERLIGRTLAENWRARLGL
jgi:hypothetical protein